MRHELVAAVALTAWLIPTSAYAQDAWCVPRAIGVPISGADAAPKWDTNLCGGATVTPECSANDDDPRFRDPRWTGSATESLSTSASTSSPAWLRAMHRSENGGDVLYVWLNADIDIAPDDQRVAWLAIDGPDKLLIRFRSKESSVQRAEPLPTRCDDRAAICDNESAPGYSPTSFSLYPWRASPTSGGQTVHIYTVADATTFGTPSWLDEVRYWRLGQRWAMMLRIPIRPSASSSLDDGIAADSKVWMELLQTEESSGIVTGWHYPAAGAIRDDLPGMNGSAGDVGYADNEPLPWATVTTDVSTPACADGISIDRMDMAVVEAGSFASLDALRTQDFASANAITPGAGNVFVARPVNGDTSSLPSNTIEARFRLANWGSQALAPDNPALWKDIPTGQAWYPLNENVNAGDKGVVHSNDDASAATWASGAICSNNDRTTCPAGSIWKHQCLMVQLRPASGAALTVRRDSHYRNMNFDLSASTLEHDAEIATLPTSPSGERWVYLYVRTRNMPATYRGATNLLAVISDKLELRADRLIDLWQKPSTMPAEVKESYERAQRFYEALELRRLTDDTAAEYLRTQFPPHEQWDLMPAYEVFAFHETEDKRTIGDKEYTVLAPQTAFGYRVWHSGSLSGWSAVLDGAQKINDNLYRIRLPDGEHHVVRTRIKTLESRTDRPLVADSTPLGEVGANDPSKPPGCTDGTTPPCAPCKGCCCKKSSLGRDELAGNGLVVLITCALLHLVATRRRRRRAIGS